MKKFSAILIALLLNPAMLVAAEGEEASPSPSSSAEAESTASSAAETDALSLHAYSAVLIDEASGTVLYKANADAKADPSGLTKMMGVYLACESLASSQSLTMSDAAFQTYDHSSGVLWIQLGEKLTASDAEYASMLGGYNDTMAMLAEAVSVEQDAFVSEMNAEAEELGMSNTHFDNIFGNYSESNYSTAGDLAILVRTALQNEQFAEIFSTSGYSIPETNMTQSRPVGNACQLLRSTSSYYNAEIKGGMLGYNSTNGYAAAALNERDGGKLIAVVTGEESEDAAYADLNSLFEYGYANYQTVSITPEEIGVRTIEVTNASGKHSADVTFKVTSGFEALLPSDINADDLKAEIQVENEDADDPDEITAQVVFTLNGEKVGSAEMEKSVKTYDTSFRATTGAAMRTWFDGISIFILAFIVVFPIVVKIARGLMPPE